MNYNLAKRVIVIWRTFIMGRKIQRANERLGDDVHTNNLLTKVLLGLNYVVKQKQNKVKKHIAHRLWNVKKQVFTKVFVTHLMKKPQAFL